MENKIFTNYTGVSTHTKKKKNNKNNYRWIFILFFHTSSKMYIGTYNSINRLSVVSYYRTFFNYSLYDRFSIHILSIEDNNNIAKTIYS